MNDLLRRVADVNRRFERSYVDWVAANDMGEPMAALYPPLTTAELATLEDAAGAPLTDEVKELLAGDVPRVGLELANCTEEIGNVFAWLDSAETIGETKRLREAASEYDWEIPPCVVFSATSSEPVAYRLDTRQMITISAHDDGEVTELDVGLAEWLERYVGVVERQIAAGYGN